MAVMLTKTKNKGIKFISIFEHTVKMLVFIFNIFVSLAAVPFKRYSFNIYKRRKLK